MKLHLLRHAKTNQISPTGKDFDRELLPRAFEQSAELKRYLQDHTIAPKHILCSSAVRTRQTLDQIKAFFADVPVTFLDELYLASAGELLKIINELQSPEDILLKTCGLVSLEFPFESSAMVSKETGVLVGSFRVG